MCNIVFLFLSVCHFLLLSSSIFWIYLLHLDSGEPADVAHHGRPQVTFRKRGENENAAEVRHTQDVDNTDATDGGIFLSVSKKLSTIIINHYCCILHYICHWKWCKVLFIVDNLTSISVMLCYCYIFWLCAHQLIRKFCIMHQLLWPWWMSFKP